LLLPDDVGERLRTVLQRERLVTRAHWKFGEAASASRPCRPRHMASRVKAAPVKA
jgi:hypothetical protein